MESLSNIFPHALAKLMVWPSLQQPPRGHMVPK